MSMFPGGWVPESVVMEGMFLINMHQSTSHPLYYTQFLVRRFAVPHCVKGAKEVHIVFDSPGYRTFSIT